VLDTADTEDRLYMKRIVHFLVSLLLMASAPAFADAIAVAVAANVQYAFDDLRAAFQQETGHEVRAVYNSSGKFTAQIMNGAPFDVFLSADMAYPKTLHKAGFAAAAPKPYAYGSLVLWTRKDINLADWQRLLAGPAVRKLALANPRTAPYGREAMRILAYYKLDTMLEGRLVFGESIAQVNQYIHSGTVDLGFTAKSVVLSPELKGQGKWIDLPRESYEPIAQGAVILRHGKENNPALAQRFYDFLYGPKARAIFMRYGYLLP
jgi:molybdate transport system substrate-binding protein